MTMERVLLTVMIVLASVGAFVLVQVLLDDLDPTAPQKIVGF